MTGFGSSFLTGSQDLLRRGDPDGKSREQSAAHRGRPGGCARHPCRDRPQADGDDAGRHPPRLPGGHGRRRLHRGHRLDAHVLARPRCGSPGLQALGKPFLHLHTQYGRDLPYADIDMDFMNLNQSAHGDREFAYIVSRLRMPRKTIAGHWREPAVQARIGAWMRATVGAHEARALKVVRFGDNMREVADTDGDKVEVQARLGISCNTLPRQRAGRRRRPGGRCGCRAALRRVRRPLRRGAGAAARRRPPRVAAGRGAHRAGPSGLPGRGRLRAFVDTFQDLGGLKQLPGIGAQRLMADGYGFGAEGDWKSSALVRIVKAMSAGPGRRRLLHGGLHLRLRCRFARRARRAHARGLPDHRRRQPSCEIHPLFVGEREDPVRLVFSGAAGPAVVVGLVDMGTRLRLVANEIDAIAPPGDLPKAARRPRAVGAPPDFTTSAESWLLAGGPHHTAYSQAVGLDVIGDFAEMVGVELLAIGAKTDADQFHRELQWSNAYWHLAGAV